MHTSSASSASSASASCENWAPDAHSDGAAAWFGFGLADAAASALVSAAASFQARLSRRRTYKINSLLKKKTGDNLKGRMLAPLVLVVLSLLLGMVTTTYAQQANVVTNQTGDGDGGNLLNEKTADAVTVSATTTTTTTTTVSKPLIKAAWQVLDTVDATTFGNHIGYTRAARVPFESGEDGLLVIAPDPIDPLRQSTHQMSTSPWLRHNGAWSPATSGGNRTRNHPVGRKIGAVVATTDDGVLAYGGIRQTDSSTAHFADKRIW